MPLIQLTYRGRPISSLTRAQLLERAHELADTIEGKTAMRVSGVDAGTLSSLQRPHLLLLVRRIAILCIQARSESILKVIESPLRYDDESTDTTEILVGGRSLAELSRADLVAELAFLAAEELGVSEYQLNEDELVFDGQSVSSLSTDDIRKIVEDISLKSF